MAVLTSVVSLMLLMTTSVQGDFPCICNYNIESAVYGSTAKGSPIGYLYEFDCKPEGPSSNDPNWRIIQFEQKYGYLENGKGVEAQTCPGLPPVVDSVTTSTASITSGTTATQTVATTTTSTPEPTTTALKTSAPSTTITTTRTSVTTTTSTPPQTTPTTTTTTPVPATATTTTTTTTPKPTTTPTTTTPEPKTTSTTTPKPTPTTTPITTTVPITTTTTTTRPTTTHRPTQAPTSTTTANFVGPSSQGQYSCPLQYVQHAQLVQGASFIIDSTCYEIVPTDVTWEHAEADCVARGGHLAHIPDQRHQDIIYNKTMQHLRHDIWIGFHDRNLEQHYEWSSGDPVTFSNWQSGHESFAHNFDDCVSLAAKSLHGRWDDTTCNWLMAYLCEFNDANGMTTPPHSLFTGVSITDGDTRMCPHLVQVNAEIFNYPLARHGSSCYELQIDDKVTWTRGETYCSQYGGHLVTITSADEQAFVEAFMSRHNPGHAVWIGLHDRNVEGKYEWTSGESLTYTNWIPNHKGNFESTETEDCVVLVPYKSGEWDDIPCGFRDPLFGDVMGATYYSFCEYKTVSSAAPLIG